MNKKIVIAIISTFIITLILIITFYGKADIISYCIGDANNDGVDEILFILGDHKKNENGEKYGHTLSICKMEYINQIKKRIIKNVNIDISINLESIKPIKVMVGDINGDGLKEISLCVYKSTKFHPEMAKRPFFYLLNENDLTPIWRGSSLSRPFYDYELFDIDEDGIDEIISLEYLKDKKLVLTSYSWDRFGFSKDSESECLSENINYDTLLSEINEGRTILKYNKENNEIFINRKED